jgi:hypothetical protein
MLTKTSLNSLFILAGDATDWRVQINNFMPAWAVALTTTPTIVNDGLVGLRGLKRCVQCDRQYVAAR